MLNNKELKELISVARQYLNLTETVIEKDYYVTQVIHALSGIENDHFRLVFAGGTCLAKAHKVVKRMSEDLDFKIHIKNKEANISKSQFLKELKQFRSEIKSKLAISGLRISTPIVRNEGQYSRIEIEYPPSFPLNTKLRPHILLEFTLSDINLAVENLLIKTLIEDTLQNTVIFDTPSTQCISVDETAIEKWVSLTRRIAAIERHYQHDDTTLVRHLYDLNAVEQLDKINRNFFTLAKKIILQDGKQFKNQHPEYFIDPATEIKNSLNLLKHKSIWKIRYQEFIETMVYDDISAYEYEDALHTLEKISLDVIHSLNP